MDPNTDSIGSPGFLPARTENGISIGGVAIERIAYKGAPVVTFAMIDKVHERPDGTAGRNFRENRTRFVEGEDFVELTSDEIRRMSADGIFPARTARATVLTQRGYLKLTKPMNDDRAWQVQGEMIDRYFVVEAARSLTPAEMLLEQAKMMVSVERKQAALEMAQAEQAERIATTERRLEQIETSTHHFTCIGYARWVKKVELDLKTASALGRIASKRCRELGIPITKIPDPRFGYVNQFPKAIIDEAWDDKFGRAA